MSRFTSHLGLILYEDDRGRARMKEGRTQWFVNPMLTYDVGEELSGETITVPAYDPAGKTDAEIIAALILGTIFLTDLGSIPQVAWSLGLSPAGEAAKAFVIHDRIYVMKGLNVGFRVDFAGDGEPVSYTRKQADDLLNEAMKVCGVPAWKRAIIYAAVRLGGANGWGK